MRWTPPELEKLQSLVGDLPWAIVVQTYRAWAEKNGFPRRGEPAMRQQAHLTKSPRYCVGEFLTPGAIAEILGSTRSVCGNWVTLGYVKCHRQGNRRYVSRDELRRMARENPQVLFGFPSRQLELLLEDPKLVRRLEKLSAAGNWRRRRPIFCVETGQRFNTIRAAAEFIGASSQSVHYACRNGTRVKGFHWNYVA